MANQLLLVDDSPLIHRVVELTFEGQDFEIHPAETREQALALARSLKLDIVVASAEMKGVGGAEICRSLREEGNLGETPVLLLASGKSGLSEGEARQAGAAGLLIKPFEPERLLAEVGRVLARAASGQGAGVEEVRGAAAPELSEQMSPASQELFEDHELEALFSGGAEEHPAQMPAHPQDESDLLHQAEKVLDQTEPAGGGAPPKPAAAEPQEQDIKLFDDTELDELFAEEVEQDPNPAPAAPETAPPKKTPAEEWGDLDLDDEITPRRTGARTDLADLAREQASAAEAQLAELEAELGSAPSEEDVEAAESKIEDLQEELSRDLAGAGTLEWSQPAAKPPGGGKERTQGADSDLLALAAEAGFRGPVRPEPEMALDSETENELDLEAELAAAGVGESEGASSPAAPKSEEELALDDLLEAGYSLPTEEEGGGAAPGDKPPRKEAAPQAHRAERPSAETAPPEDVEPIVRQSLERTVEAIVPSLLRNIEALVVRQLPELVEKIVLREIEKIKRGE